MRQQRGPAWRRLLASVVIGTAESLMLAGLKILPREHPYRILSESLLIRSKLIRRRCLQGRIAERATSSRFVTFTAISIGAILASVR
jgi:hypothetical protein